MSKESNGELIERDGVKETREVANASWYERFFFLRTTFAVLFTVLLVCGGLFAYLSLTKESLPDLEIPMATITTEWPGADPQTVEEQVTQEIEDEIATLKGLKTFSSASFDSFSVISVEFEADQDTDSSMQSLRDAVADSEANLPTDIDAPSIQQVSVDDRPIMTVALYGDAPEATLNQIAEEIEDRLETFSGVNEVNLGGSRKEIVQILLDPQRLLALGVSPSLVRQSISNANLDQPFGEIRSETIGAVVRLEGQFKTIDDLRNLPITRLGSYENVRPVRLGEVATVERQLETEESRAFFSKSGEAFEETIEISITKSPGSDTIQVIRDIREELQTMRNGSGWPNGLNYEVTQDNSEDIWDSLTNVFVNGLQAMVAVFVILFLILTWREGLIAGLSIPISFAGTMLIVWLLGYTLNELVIIGMVLALGLLVDVFILMMEGIHDEIYSQKKTFGQAALATIKKYGMPAFAGQLTTILALAPLAAISGISGKFIRVLPVTAISCLIMAFAVALLASVPLSRFLMGPVAKRGADVKETPADRIMGSLSRRLESWSLALPLRSKKIAGAFVAGAVLLFVLSIFAGSRIPVTLYPKTDGLTLGINLELPPSTTLEATQDVADGIGEILTGKTYFDSVIKLVGRKSSYATEGALEPVEAENYIGYSIRFKERSERDATSFELANELRSELGEYVSEHIPGASIVIAEEASGPNTGDPIQIEITGDDLSELQRLSRSVQNELIQVEGASDVRDNLGASKSEIALVPIREAADFFGLTQQDLAAQLRFALANDPIGTFVTLGPEDDLDIHLGLNWQSRHGEGGSPRTMEEIVSVRAFTQSGETVALFELLEPRISEAPTSVIHAEGRRAITVLAKTEDRSVSAILSDFEPKLQEMSADWPNGFEYQIKGEAEETAETFGSAGIMLVLALILVFGVLVLVFGSFSQAFILMTTMPLALIGTFLGFWLFGFELSFFAVIGVISLIGIVANNGIVMVDTMNTELKSGKSVQEAAADGAAQRLRPILTTSLTTIVGLVPLALGSPMYAPLCYAIVFGLVMSTILSLLIVPCLYLLLTSDDQLDAASLD
ncbi:efflux RND transporter permease subunit [Ponticaulis profundi]|uniref:Efflux RND transporter permease subunit n=1 Tax=Ponticaulis profundi TaxID=2665222 RepID=A0ABW1S9Y9_9PROT